VGLYRSCKYPTPNRQVCPAALGGAPYHLGLLRRALRMALEPTGAVRKSLFNVPFSLEMDEPRPRMAERSARSSPRLSPASSGIPGMEFPGNATNACCGDSLPYQCLAPSWIMPKNEPLFEPSGSSATIPAPNPSKLECSTRAMGCRSRHVLAERFPPARRVQLRTAPSRALLKDYDAGRAPSLPPNYSNASPSGHGSPA